MFSIWTCTFFLSRCPLSGRYAVPQGVSNKVFGLVPSSLAGVLCLAGMLYQREYLIKYLDLYLLP
jgi:hypothetical protein